jgi:DNA-binding IclR family transcriptional regulator
MHQSAVLTAIYRGSRTVTEIAALTAHRPKEVRVLIWQLQRKGLIRETGMYPALADEPARKFWTLTHTGKHAENARIQSARFQTRLMDRR